VYSANDVDLVFCGHAHGGQIRLPVVKGLYAPHQGVNPKYTEGMHEQNGTTMVVSRGLGNSRFPFRVFNHPEVVAVELRSEA
jgi:Predicted phosphohydrolases